MATKTPNNHRRIDKPDRAVGGDPLNDPAVLETLSFIQSQWREAARRQTVREADQEFPPR